MTSGTLTTKGVIRGKIIELERESGWPEGQPVKVTLEVYAQPGAPSSEGLRRAFGGWVDDIAGLDEFLKQVRLDREDRQGEPTA